MPLQLKRRRQSVDAFIQQLHDTIIAAIDVDFANPDRPARFNLYYRVRRCNAGAAHPSKTFSHTLEKPRPIVIPLIAILFADEFCNSIPISAVDRVKKMLCVKANLMLRSPKPKQIQADREYNRQ